MGSNVNFHFAVKNGQTKIKDNLKGKYELPKEDK
jgi:hypothetical protein